MSLEQIPWYNTHSFSSSSACRRFHLPRKRIPPPAQQLCRLLPMAAGAASVEMIVRLPIGLRLLDDAVDALGGVVPQAALVAADANAALTVVVVFCSNT